MQTQAPLRYQVSSWKQLTRCQSNNSRDLSISVSEFIQDSRLRGTRIAVQHSQFGTLFACLVDAVGSLLSPADGLPSSLSPAQICEELAKFGFLVNFSHRGRLSGDLLQYLMSLRDLKFDKIRLINLPNDGLDHTSGNIVVAFQAAPLGNWLNNWYCPTRAEFQAAVVAGHACNVTGMVKSQDFPWSWLAGFVANIDDVLRDNLEV